MVDATGVPTGGALFHVMVCSFQLSSVFWMLTSMSPLGSVSTQYRYSLAEIISLSVGIMFKLNFRYALLIVSQLVFMWISRSVPWLQCGCVSSIHESSVGYMMSV